MNDSLSNIRKFSGVNEESELQSHTLLYAVLMSLQLTVAVPCGTRIQNTIKRRNMLFPNKSDPFIQFLSKLFKKFFDIRSEIKI